MAVKAVLLDFRGGVIESSGSSTDELFAKGTESAHAKVLEQGHSLEKLEPFLDRVRRALEQEERRTAPRAEAVVAGRVIQRLMAEQDCKLSAREWKAVEAVWVRPAIEATQPAAGAQKALMGLLEQKARLAAAVHSRWSLAAAEAWLDHLGLWEFFDAIVVSSELGHRMPSPKFYATALQKLHCSPGETIFASSGPMEHIEGARSAGMTTLQIGSDVPDLAGLLKRIGGLML